MCWHHDDNCSVLSSTSASSRHRNFITCLSRSLLRVAATLLALQVRHRDGLWHTYMLDDEWKSPALEGLEQYVIAPAGDADIFVTIETWPRFNDEGALPPGGPPPRVSGAPPHLAGGATSAAAAGGAGGPSARGAPRPSAAFTFAPPPGSALANPPAPSARGSRASAQPQACFPPFFDSQWNVMARESELVAVVLNNGQRFDDGRALVAAASGSVVRGVGIDEASCEAVMSYVAANAGEPVTLVAMPAFSSHGKGRFRITVYSSAPLLLLRDHDDACSAAAGRYGVAGGGFPPVSLPVAGAPEQGSFSTFGTPPLGRSPPFSAAADRGRRAFRVLAPSVDMSELPFQISIPGLGGVRFGFSFGFGGGKR